MSLDNGSTPTVLGELKRQTVECMKNTVLPPPVLVNHPKQLEEVQD
jgi:hypothetical protein